MVDSTDTDVNVLKKKEKKSKNMKVANRESSIVDTPNTESSVKKKKDKKVKKEKEELLGESDSNIVVKTGKKREHEANENDDEVQVRKKKPFFRDRGEKRNNLDATDSKSKFSISLPLSDGRGAVDIHSLPKSSGKGPKIIIAQDKQADKKQTNKKEKLNKRKKKLKAEGKLTPESEMVHESKGMNKALRYLKMWSEDRSSWKFEKCRQIWLLHNAYDDTKVSDIMFPSLLNYMESIKGGMRNSAVAIATDKIDKSAKWEEMLAEDKSEDEIQKELGSKISEVELKRATKIKDTLS